MKRRCSLRLDLLPGESHPVWQLFDRLTGANGGIARTIPLSHSVDPGKIIESFNHEIIAALNDSNHPISAASLRAWGRGFCTAIFPDEILHRLSAYESGDILFMVPLHWADLPFEILCLPSGFLGERFQIGTIINTGATQGPEKQYNHEGEMVIIADPADSLQSADREGEHLKTLAVKRKRPVRLLMQADNLKLITTIPEASIVHFAGHSGPDRESDVIGWELGSGQYFTTDDIDRVGAGSVLPWLVFSNSCDGGRIVVNTGLSGIAGAFLSAGVHQVIGPFCKLNDRQAVHCSVSFYNHLFNKKCPSQALTLLRREQKNGAGITALFYRLFGDPLYREYSKEQRRFKKRYLLGALLLILVLFATAVNRPSSMPKPPKPEGWIEIMKAYQGLEALLATEDLEKGVHNIAEKNFGGALHYFKKASDTLTILHDEIGLIICWNYTGSVYRELGMTDSALSYYRQALVKAEKAGENVARAVCLKNIGDIYRKDAKIDTAMEYYRRSLAINSSSDKNDEPLINLEIGEVFKFSVNLYAPTFIPDERNGMQKFVPKDNVSVQPK